MNASERILDILTKHEVDLQRYGNATVRKIIALMKRAEADILGQVVAADPEGKTVERLNELIEAIRHINVNAAAQIQRAIEGELGSLAAYEATFTRDLLRTTIPVKFDVVTPAAEQIAAATLSRPFQGRLLREWITGLSEGAQSRVRDAIRLGVVEGETTQQIVTRIRGTKANAYKDGIFETSRRSAETMVRTALNHTANYAREEVYKAQGDLVKGVKWVSTLDSRTTEICMARDGKVYPLGEGPRPPAHYNCLPGGARIAPGQRIAAAFKRRFNGDMFVITTSSGRKLSCTPNHPVLTDGGWVEAKRLNVGNRVACYGVSERPSAGANGKNVEIDPSIHEITEALIDSSKVSAGPIPSSAVDFHGDGADQEVTVVRPDVCLRDETNSGIVQVCGKDGLIIGLPFSSITSPRGGGQFLLGAAFFAAPSSIVGGSDQGGALTGGRSVHSGLLLRGSVSDSDAAFDKDSLNGTWRDAEHIRDAANADAVSVFFDDVVDVKSSQFCGHVYNLQTDNGLILADGIVTHNCRSTTVPVLASWKDLGFDVEDMTPQERASMNGQVPADKTYSDWLKDQPRAVVEEALGKTKAKLFLDGNLPVDRFVNNQGVTLTLDELRARDAHAFKRAGL